MKKLIWSSLAASLSACLILFAYQANASGFEKPSSHAAGKTLALIYGKSLTVSINSDGSYSLMSEGISGEVLRSNVEADVNNEQLLSSAYPLHKTSQTDFHDQFGTGSVLTVTHSGLPGKPDLLCTFRLYNDQTWGDIAVQLINSTGKTVTVQAIRNIQIAGNSTINLNGQESADRVLSDSFSEDQPQLAIYDLGGAPNGIHRAVQSQLIYNRSSRLSLFLGALTADRWLTIFHLKEQGVGANAKIVSYDVASTGTTEFTRERSLLDSPAAEQVLLSLPVETGASLASERMLFSVAPDYHAQLEQYGHLIKLLHNARVNVPTPIGWWSWTAYYFGINQGAAITNANWLAKNLKDSGYTYFHIDEGYPYARGEYISPDANLFPLGMFYVGNKVRGNGLTFGIWTAPFEVSERAWVYQNHKEWLLHNANGQLIRIGFANNKDDQLYVLDATHPGAQEYLRKTYSTLYNWGVRFIKMDFMDDTSVEGAYYRHNTTALEAQRIGLEIIRKTMGEDAVLDKDGSTMLNPVGIVDAGRLSLDTGHTFEASRDAATGIAARYYMNRNFYITDPDAFTVSTQTVFDEDFHNNGRPLTFDEAKVSIALAAISGGMFEIGDDLPTLGTTPERLALVKNNVLLDMARLGHASTPVDLLTYAASDAQPSIFLLNEDKRQSVLTVFNWTEGDLSRSLRLVDIGLKDPQNYQISDVFGDKNCCASNGDALNFVQPPHSVRIFKLIEKGIEPLPPAFQINAPTVANSGETIAFHAASVDGGEPTLNCHWEFGDGTSEDGLSVLHAFTHAGEYSVHAIAIGLDASTNSKTVAVKINGNISTTFNPADKKRPE